MEEGDSMALTVGHVTQILEKLAPKHLAEEWDNIGLQVGTSSQGVERILVALTVTPALVQRAVMAEIDMIVVHHPLIFKPIRHVRWDNPLGIMLKELANAEIAVYVSHTNLDHAANGLNTWLAEDLGLDAFSVLVPTDDTMETGLGRIGLCDPVTLADLVRQVRDRWNTEIRYVGHEKTVCRKIAVCGGSGGSLVRRAAAQGADVLITGDVDYHDALEAQHLGLAVIDAGHFGTEQIMISRISEHLKAELSDEDVAVLRGQDGDRPWKNLERSS